MYFNELIFFQILDAHRNKYSEINMAGRNSTLYLGHKWMNIPAGEII